MTLFSFEAKLGLVSPPLKIPLKLYPLIDLILYDLSQVSE